jgi:hypothetical protein
VPDLTNDDPTPDQRRRILKLKSKLTKKQFRALRHAQFMLQTERFAQDDPEEKKFVPFEMDRTPVVDEEAIQLAQEKNRVVKIPWKRVPMMAFELLSTLKGARQQLMKVRAFLEKNTAEMAEHYSEHFSSVALKLLTYWENLLRNRKRYDLARIMNCGCNQLDYFCDHKVLLTIPKFEIIKGKKFKLPRFSVRDKTIHLKAQPNVVDLQKRR